VTTRVHEALKNIGKSHDFITVEEIKTFCKNSNFLNVLRYRTLEEERNPKTAKGSLFASQLSEDPVSNIVWYFALRGVDIFYTQHKRYPGSEDSTVAADVETLKAIVQKLLSDLSINVSLDAKYIKEIVRFGAAELHPIASLIGGIASQEVIKAITHMYTPLNNTFIFNGVNSTSLTIAV